MKRTITATALILSLSMALSAPQVMAAEHQPDTQTNQKSTEQSWQEALKVQVALAKAKVSLLQARSELWAMQNKEAALKSLDEANASLDKSWHSADLIMRTHITELKLEIDQAKLLIQKKGQAAEVELQAIASRTESALNSALVKTQTKSKVLQEQVTNRYALVQANAAALKAQVALEIEQSPEKAEQALKEAEDALLRAKDKAGKIKDSQISKMYKQAQVAKNSVKGEIGDAKTHIRELVTATNAQIELYDQKLQETEEVKLLKKRYTYLEAQAALLNAQLATKADATGKQAAAYLNESQAWYESLKADVEKLSEKELARISADIEEAKQAIQRKDKQARAKLAELLDQAAEMVKD